jgi:hypothetical protein
MSLDERAARYQDLESQASPIFATIGGLDPEGFSDRFVQELMTCAIRLYSQRERTDGGVGMFKADEVTATDVARTVGPMLEAVGLQLFELSMWKDIGRP